ncbi:MAG: succinate dehydrogenase, cytochrome b556 subunit [Wolbachia endosymbiont of Tyrophagus putrescentiae]|nr:succinate dehydrogenase, cytochrome b556 subunit [Wolbachia endosymbiont of Tyrophagus putrescentiae]
MKNRPLSPHLQIYKIQGTLLFSGTHRLTGVLLFFLLIAFSWYFILHVYFPESSIVEYLSVLLSSVVVKLICFFSFVSFTYHCLNGIRHLLWDMGVNLEIAEVSLSAMLLTLMLLFSSIVFLFVLI